VSDRSESQQRQYISPVLDQSRPWPPSSAVPCTRCESIDIKPGVVAKLEPSAAHDTSCQAVW